MKEPKAAAATMNAGNTYVVKIHNEHDKMRFLDTFPMLLFVKTKKMDHKLRVTLSTGRRVFAPGKMGPTVFPGLTLNASELSSCAVSVCLAPLSSS